MKYIKHKSGLLYKMSDDFTKYQYFYTDENRWTELMNLGISFEELMSNNDYEELTEEDIFLELV